MRVRFAAAVAVCAAGSAGATELTFDIDGLTNGSIVTDSYGDRVTSLVDGGFAYGAAGGFTPNIEIDYRGDNGNELSWWGVGYSGLQGVLYNEPDGTNGFEVEFTADAGWNVVLDSFDIGNFGGAVTVGVSVRTGAGDVLFEDAAFALAASGNPASSFSLTNVQAQSLILRIDTTGLGGASDNVGIDNIVFSQIVPAPGAAGLLVLSAGLASRRRR